jgi:ribosomal protein S13
MGVGVYHGVVDVFGFTFFVDTALPIHIGSRVREIRNLELNRFCIRLMGDGDGDAAVCVSVHPERAGIVVTDLSIASDDPNSRSSVYCGDELARYPHSPFTHSLDRELRSAVLTRIAHPAGERRVELFFERTGEFGKRTARSLVIEIMGRHSGAYLLNKRRIIVSVARRVDGSSNRFRRVITGKPYPPPPQLSKPSAFGIGIDEFEAALTQILGESESRRSNVAEMNSANVMTVHRALPALLTGIDIHLATRIVEAAEMNDDATLGELTSDAAARNRIHSVLAKMTTEQGLMRALGFRSRNELERYYLERVFQDFSIPSNRLSKAGYRARVEPPADAAMDAQARRARAIARGFARTGDADALVEIADWITAAAATTMPLNDKAGVDEIRNNAKALAKRLGCVETASPLLNRDLEPAALAGLLRKKAARYRRAQSRIVLMQRDAQETTLKETPGADTLSEKRRLELSSLRKLGIRHRLYLSSDDIPIVLGLDARANDALLKRYGGAPHWWFHARDVSGSWVVALTGRSPLPDRTRIECAIVAAAHSRDKDEASVDVSYTQMKHLRKPKGGKPGMALVQHERTVTVNPAEFAEMKDRLSGSFRES